MVQTLTPRIAAVRRLDGKHYETTEVAHALGIAPQLLRRWHNKGIPQASPSHQFLFEGQWVYLYDESAFESVRRYRLRHRGTGQMWSEEENADRTRRRMAANDAEKRAQKRADAGDGAGAAEAERIARDLRAQLAQESEERRVERSTACRDQDSDQIRTLTSQ